jgi:hypothetical protein
MKGKVLLIVGLGVGYVLGARAGRERYDQIADAVGKLWRSPRVQKQVDRSMDFVNDKVDAVMDIAATGAKNVVSRVTGGKPAASAPAKRTTTASKPAATRTPAKSPASKSASAKPASSSTAGKDA